MRNYLLVLLLLLTFQVCPAHSDSNVDSSKIVAEINAGNKRILDSLLEGNDRFSSGNSIHPHISKERIHLLSDKQNPFVVIIACSDSRVPPEIIFDQGLGDIFVVRTAGNVIGNYELGSVEYAVEHLNCRLVIVLGHERCGAVSAYMDSNGHKHNNHIDSIIECIGSKELVKNLRGEKGEKLPAIIRANIEDDVRFLRASEPVLKELMDKNEIEIIGAIYDPLTGKAIFLEE